MNTIQLENFKLEQMVLTKIEHLKLIRSFDNDDVVKKYLYPYKASFYDLVESKTPSPTIFNNFYVIYYKDRIIGYIELENSQNVKLNCALLEHERNKGLTSRLLKELSTYLLDNYDDVRHVSAIIDNNNKASIKTVKNSGFDFYEESDGFSTYGRKKK